LDLAISLTLHSWPALTLAVQHSLGGPDSAEKRDFLAATLSELLLANPSMDEEDVEDVLLQYLTDEFEIELEDNSEVDVAYRVVAWRGKLVAGEGGAVEELEAGYRAWKERGGQKIVVHRGADDEESEGSEEDDAMDVDDQEAPELVRTKPVPEVDEEGFTKVVGKKRR
ncbi:hypothetical protein P152DRAFT_370848, partial [Eremomyces bilateralis CBS 781.70]